jgi:hypothetical protein
MPLSEDENHDKVREDIERKPVEWREVTVAEVYVDADGRLWAIVTENGESQVEQV